MDNSSNSPKRICYRCEDCGQIFMNFDTFEAHKKSSCTSPNGLPQTSAETVLDCCHRTTAETFQDCCHRIAAEAIADCCHETAFHNNILVSRDDTTECSSSYRHSHNWTRTRRAMQRNDIFFEYLEGMRETEGSLRKELLQLDNETSHKIMRLNDYTKRLFKLIQDQQAFEYRLTMQRLWWAMEAKIFTFNRFVEAGAEIAKAVNAYIDLKHKNEKTIESSNANLNSKQTLSNTDSPELISSNVTIILAQIRAAMEAEKSAIFTIETAIRNQKLAGEKVLEAAEKEEAVLITTMDDMAELNQRLPSHFWVNMMHNLQSSLMECKNLLKTLQQDVEHCHGVISALIDKFGGFSSNQKNENMGNGEASTSVTQQGMPSTDTVQEMDDQMDSS